MEEVWIRKPYKYSVVVPDDDIFRKRSFSILPIVL